MFLVQTKLFLLGINAFYILYIVSFYFFEQVFSGSKTWTQGIACLILYGRDISLITY